MVNMDFRKSSITSPMQPLFTSHVPSHEHDTHPVDSPTQTYALNHKDRTQRPNQATPNIDTDSDGIKSKFRKLFPSVQKEKSVLPSIEYQKGSYTNSPNELRFRLPKLALGSTSPSPSPTSSDCIKALEQSNSKLFLAEVDEYNDVNQKLPNFSIPDYTRNRLQKLNHSSFHIPKFEGGECYRTPKFSIPELSPCHLRQASKCSCISEDRFYIPDYSQCKMMCISNPEDNQFHLQEIDCSTNQTSNFKIPKSCSFKFVEEIKFT